ncbi:MAG TPA: efflux RND transporter periplasmic adaptor subunit [Rudaea sp.]|nr:efflux RND transporter periplasmic adaptor subunit [Rudaea sp.]
MGVMENSDLLRELRIDRRETEPASRTPLWLALGAVALVIVGSIAWFALSGSSAPAVHTAIAKPMSSGGASASVLDATGYVTARRSATVSAQITGTLIEVLIEEGDHVKEGQVLARLEDTAQRAAVAQAQAQLHSAQALLAQYQAQLAQNRRDSQRMEDMVGRKLVSTQQAEQAHTLVETLSAQVETQKRQINLAEASVAAAQVQLGYCTVRAPFSGVIIAKAAQVGEIVSPLSAGGGFTRTGVGTIVDMDSLEVEVDVNEAYIGRVVAGNPVESVLNAYPDWKIPSHVIAIIPTADRSKATVKVRIGLDLKDDRIVPDMGVRVSFLEEKKPAAQAQQQPAGVLVPSAALRKDADKDIVFVLKEQKAQRRAVTLGGSVGDQRQVLGGVAAGETVIVDAPEGLKDGAAVALAKP